MTTRARGLALFFGAVAGLCLGCGAACKAQEAKPEPPRSFVFHLVDGSRLVCTPQITAIPVTTSFAKLDVPLEKIARVSFGETNEPATFHFNNSDQLRGKVELEKVEIVTSFGKFAVQVAHITEITVSGLEEEKKREVRDTPEARNACINNLRMIDAAKEQWALEHNLADGAVADPNGISQYIRGARLPVCPAGGVYKINAIGRNPECSVPGHRLPGAGGME